MPIEAFAKVPIGRTGVSVTRLGLGCAALSGLVEAGGLYGGVGFEEGMEVATAAFKAGVRYFDTAPLYGNAARFDWAGRLRAETGTL